LTVGVSDFPLNLISLFFYPKFHDPKESEKVSWLWLHFQEIFRILVFFMCIWNTGRDKIKNTGILATPIISRDKTWEKKTHPVKTSFFFFFEKREYIND
jgi:hypothetical protein